MSDSVIGNAQAGSSVASSKPEPRFESLEALPDQPPFGRALLEQLGVRGLHCGSAGILRLGPWINSDVMKLRVADGNAPELGRLSRVDGRLYLRHDAMQPFPFEDGSFEWVYSEHFIEHLYPTDAVKWLTEMRRLLKPGGYARISTPDLRKYVKGYLEPENGFFAEHHGMLSHALGRFMGGVTESTPSQGREFYERYRLHEDEVPRRPAFVMNQIFYLWEHRWIYDPDELRHVASAAGFPPELAVECDYREGRDAEVSRLDLPYRSDESLYFELERG
jgi:predicted SAM-dependent methyltransferase